MGRLYAKYGGHKYNPTKLDMWSKGGKTKPENLQMLCADCNARKSNKF